MQAGTQIQRKLGPYIDTFLSSMLMSRIDGRASTPALNARVHQALQKTVAKIAKHQQSDGSWNMAGGWAAPLFELSATNALGSYSLACTPNRPRGTPMITICSSRRLTFSALALLLALGAQRVSVAGQNSSGTSALARVDRLAQNVERAESVRAVKRVQETYAQYSQFGLWNEMAALFSDNASLSYGQDTGQGRQAIQNYTRFDLRSAPPSSVSSRDLRGLAKAGVAISSKQGAVNAKDGDLDRTHRGGRSDRLCAGRGAGTGR